MKALVFEIGKKEVGEVDPPVPAHGEVLIRTMAVGICQTDIELSRGYMNFSGIPGHEFVGRVATFNSPLFGKVVVGEINLGCGTCDWCLRGWERHCPNREVLGISRRAGAFAEMICMPEKNLHVVPECVEATEAIFVEPIAAALRIAEQVQMRPGQRALLIGDGKLGQLIARVARCLGIEIDAIGKHPDKMDLMRPFTRRIGTVLEQSQHRAYSLAIEASGSPSGLEIASKALEPLGTLILKSTYASNTTLNLSAFVVDEITIVGSRCGPFAPAVRMLSQKLVDPMPLITGVYPFEKILAAFEKAEGGALKVIATFPS
jgi:threonine dehydrogenase-like Zn-dependent dehydrogenase